MARVFVARRLSIDPRQVLGADVVLDQHDAEEPITRASLLERVAHADGLVATIAERVDEELLARAPRLRVVANHAVGIDNVDLSACTARGVQVCNTPDVLTDATADLAMALFLAAARRLREGERLVREGRFHGWYPTMLLGLELRGATLGIFGYGRIGQAVAQRARAFGMAVLYTSRDDRGPGRVSFDELLARSDAISIHAALAPETRHAFGAAQLAAMKKGALLVNTARGPLVDEAALVAALGSGHLGGAALDVYEDEPRVHPGLAGRDDVVLLPHLGSATRQTRARMAEMALSDAARVLRGERPLHPVNTLAAR